MTTEDEMRRDLSQRVLLHRRRFLAMLAGTGGAVVLGACTTDGSDGSKATTTSTTKASRPGTTTTTQPELTEAPPADGIESDPFLLGVASGDPLPGSVILWTRLVTDLVDATGQGGLGESDHAVLWGDRHG